jgi:murein DD-endopeptidase MepM/ murein hydrolase activator NlpD
MLWPIPNPPSSAEIPAGYRFGAPRPYRNGTHQGLDLGTNGTPVLAVDSGVVTFAGQSSGYGGLMIYIKHAAGWQTRYMHLKTGSFLVKKGQSVSAGQRIATADRTGITSDPAHLHFEVLKDGKKLDPLTVLGGGLGMAGVLVLAGVVWLLYRVMA